MYKLVLSIILLYYFVFLLNIVVKCQFVCLIFNLSSCHCVRQKGMTQEKVNVGVRQPYVRVVGIQVETQGSGRSSNAPIGPLEEDEFRHLAASPNIYETIARSIAPSIFGSPDIKKAIACLLFGGSRKRFVHV